MAFDRDRIEYQSGIIQAMALEEQAERLWRDHQQARARALFEAAAAAHRRVVEIARSDPGAYYVQANELRLMFNTEVSGGIRPEEKLAQAAEASHRALVADPDSYEALFI